MRPPICAVCERAVDDDGGLVQFVSRATDLAWRERAKQPGFVGHPPDTDWFCADHIELARQMAATTTIDVALKTMRATKRPDKEQPHGPEIGVVERYLRDRFSDIAARVGLAGVTVTESEDREWVLMDGSRPPVCPFVVTSRRLATCDGQSLELVFSRSHWDEDSIARASVMLTGWGAHTFNLSAHIPEDGSSLAVTDVLLSGEEASIVADLAEEIRAML